MDRMRRVVDRGPLHEKRAHAEAFASYLRSTGLYESVDVVCSTAIKSASLPGTKPKAGPRSGESDPTADLSGLFD